MPGVPDRPDAQARTLRSLQDSASSGTFSLTLENTARNFSSNGFSETPELCGFITGLVPFRYSGCRFKESYRFQVSVMRHPAPVLRAALFYTVPSGSFSSCNNIRQHAGVKKIAVRNSGFIHTGGSIWLGQQDLLVIGMTSSRARTDLSRQPKAVRFMWREHTISRRGNNRV